MITHKQINKIVLNLLEETKDYFDSTKPFVINWVPQLAYSKKLSNNRERFVYFTDPVKKYFIEIVYDLETDTTYTSTCPWFELSNWNYELADKLLKQYPLYLDPNDSIKVFVRKDLPKIKNCNRDKKIYITCYTNNQQTMGKIYFDKTLIKMLAEHELSVFYYVKILF